MGGVGWAVLGLWVWAWHLGAGGGGGRHRAFAIIFLLPSKFTAYLSGLSASNLIKSGKL